MSDFASLLLDARKRAGLSQAELAQAAGLTPSYLCTIEKRKKPPPSDDICRRLAEVLGLPPGDLIEVAHLERAPDGLRKRLRALDRSLRRERKSSLRALRSLLSPFLFAGPPGYAESALDTLGISRARRRRIRDVLDAVGRRHLDLEGEISRLVEDLPERERAALLDSLPRLLAERAERRPGPPAPRKAGPGSRDRRAGERTSPPNPPEADVSQAADAPPAPREMDTSPEVASLPGQTLPPATDLRLLPVDARLAEGFAAPGVGDRIVVDPALTPEDGDLVVVREAGDLHLRRLQRIGPMVRLATDGPTAAGAPDEARDGAPEDGMEGAPAAVGAAALLDATAFAAFWRDAGVGVVVEIRRPLRRHPREAPDAPASE